MANAVSRQPVGAALGAAVLAFAIFAGQFVFSRYGITRGLTAHDITALRYAVSGAIFLPLLLHWGIADLAGIGWRRGLALTALAGAPYYELMTVGLSIAPAAHAVVINPSLTMVSGFLLATFWLRETRTLVHAVVIIFAGIGLFLLGWEGSTLPQGHIWVGDFLFAITGAAWGVFTVLLRRWSVVPLRAAAVVSVLSLAFLPLYLLLIPSHLNHVALNDVALQALYQGFVHSILGILLFTFAVQRLGAATVSLMTPLVPAIGLSLSAILLDEFLTGYQWLGTGFVIASMIIAAVHRSASTDRR